MIAPLDATGERRQSTHLNEGVPADKGRLELLVAECRLKGGLRDERDPGSGGCFDVEERKDDNSVRVDVARVDATQLPVFLCARKEAVGEKERKWSMYAQTREEPGGDKGSHLEALDHLRHIEAVCVGWKVRDEEVPRLLRAEGLRSGEAASTLSQKIERRYSRRGRIRVKGVCVCRGGGGRSGG